MPSSSSSSSSSTAGVENDANKMDVDINETTATTKNTTIENRYTNTSTGSSSSSSNSDENATSNSADNNAVVYSPELLRMYYSRLFPFSLLYQWLCYGGSGSNSTDGNTPNTNATNNNKVFSRREFSMTIEPIKGEEIYIRYQSFRDQQQLRDAILKRRPTKIDIGAVFSHPPKDHNTIATTGSNSSKGGGFHPVQRELVFDIDLTDYDDVRACGCSGAKICRTCWTFMQMAVTTMDAGLRQDFGFTHIAWFYSGRRGIHAWVCDAAARELSDAARTAVATYFEVNLGTDKNKDVMIPYPLHPSLLRSLDVLEPLFVQYVVAAKDDGGHGLLAIEEQWTTLLATLPDTAAPVREKLLSKWASAKNTSTPAAKWAELKVNVEAYLKTSHVAKGSGGGKSSKTISTKERQRLEVWIAQTIFKYTYPRLDINVSKMRNHLLKSPFCVHPKTGRVCVPIDPATFAEFDPFEVPTLPQLMKELDEYDDDKASSSSSSQDEDDSDESDKKKKDASTPQDEQWHKTSLAPYFNQFQHDFLQPMCQEIRREERDVREQQAAATCDF